MTLSLVNLIYINLVVPIITYPKLISSDDNFNSGTQISAFIIK